MAFDLKTAINDVHSALYPNGTGRSTQRLEAFGGETRGIANDILQNLNTYSSYGSPDPYFVPAGFTQDIPNSIANEYALFNYRGMYGGLLGADPFNNYLDSSNNMLMGGPNAKNISPSKIIQFFEEVYPRIKYRPSDFLYGKYYNKIPVNHLITLRRFSLPTTDNIFDLSEVNGETGDISDVTQIAGCTAITYLGETAGNTMDSILNYSFGMNWKEQQSKLETIQSQDQGLTKQPMYNKLGGLGKNSKTAKGAVAGAAAGAIGQNALQAGKGVSGGERFKRENNRGDDKFGTTYANFVFGPVNVIDKTYTRDRGLNFSNDFKLVFEYELRSLNYVNPKIAMIDIISNMLTMTTNHGNFWGGGHRYYGSAGYVASQYGDPSLLRNGDFAGYITSVGADLKTGLTNVFGNSSGGFDLKSVLSGGLKTLKTAAGNLLGDFLASNIGTPVDQQATAAFLSAQPTGNWHVTVGNPLNPIVMMGNMVCDNGTMTFGGGLGYDDFPMDVKFELNLKHGKPRDKGDIENMFNAGRGRIYTPTSAQGDIFDTKIQGVMENVGKHNVQKLQSDKGGSLKGAQGVSNKAISNVDGKRANKNGGATGNDVENTIRMFIES